MADPIRIANCSGFFGDRLSAALEIVEGGPIDVLTGDWLAGDDVGSLASGVTPAGRSPDLPSIPGESVTSDSSACGKPEIVAQFLAFGLSPSTEFLSKRLRGFVECR